MLQNLESKVHSYSAIKYTGNHTLMTEAYSTPCLVSSSEFVMLFFLYYHVKTKRI